jgi:uncharacterized protein DUF6519
MASDISRTSDEQRYDGIVMQQGRVILDRDVNALRQTIDRRIADDALDIIGPCGTPDDGFAIGPAPGITSPASPPLWSPPVAPTSPPSAEPYDFSISAGTMYVGGQRAVFPPEVPGQGAVEYSYFDQPNWLSPPAPAAPPNQEFIYLHLLEGEVSAVEDPELKDVALGGPDTTQRLHIVKRVKRLAVGLSDCTGASEEAARTWSAAGFVFDPQTLRLIPQATLQVSYADPSTATDPCDPVAQGGYLGADNQLIRVQVISGGPTGAAPGIVWGYDNASFLYRASVSPQTPTTVVLAQSPVDAFHIPQQGQVVEVLRSAYIIDTEPNATDPQQADTIRCVAEAHGVICTLTAPYQPDTLSLSLDQSLPPEYLNDTNPLFVRIWQSQISAVTADGVTLYSLQNADGSLTGVQVTLGMQGNVLPIGAYWMFAVRPSTPQAVYPERFLIRPQPPDGPRQWVCALGTIAWNGGLAAAGIVSPPTFHDCRNSFCNLIEACNEHGDGCCTVTVRPADLAADPLALQKAADQFLDNAAGAAVCLAAGTFTLAQPLALNSRHNGLTIQACNGGATLQAAADAAPAQFLQGLVVLAGTDSITLRGLSFIPVIVDLAAALPVTAGAPADNLQASLAGLGNPDLLIGLRLQDCTHLTLTDCSFAFAPDAGTNSYGAAVFANGDCTGLQVRRCTFSAPARRRPIIGIRPITGVFTNVNATAASAATAATAATAAAGTPATGAARTSRARTTKAASAKTAATAATAAAATAAAPAAGTAAAATSATATPAAPAAASAAATPAYLTQYSSLFNVAQKLAPGVLNADDPALQPIEISEFNPVLLPSMLAAFMLMPSIDPNFNYKNPPTFIGGAGTSEAALFSQAVLTEAQFVDNRMEGLGVAVLVAANTGTVEFHDNNLSDCYGGFWYSSLNQDIVGDAGAFQAWLGAVVQQGLGPAIAMSLAMWYRLPLPPTSTPVSATAPLSPQMQILNNRIEAVPGDGSLSGPACLVNIALATAVNGLVPADINTGILFNSNHARNCSAGDVTADKLSPLYGATVFLLNASNTVVSGDLMRNLAAMSVTGANLSWSLFVLGCSGGLAASAGNITTGNSSVTVAT